MKNFLKLTIIMLVIQSMLTGQAAAASRVDDVIQIEREKHIQHLWNELGNLEDQKRQLHKIDTHLRRTKKGQSIYLQVETVAGAVLMVGVVVAGYKVYFPPGFRAMLSAYVTANAVSRGLIKLSEKEVSLLLKQITQIDVQITALETNLLNQKDEACKSLGYYLLCSYE